MPLADAQGRSSESLAIALTIAGGVVLGTLAATITYGASTGAAAARPAGLALAGGLCLAAFARGFRRPSAFVACLLLLNALVPNSSVIQDLRIAGDAGITLFARYIGRVFCFWDLLLIALALLIVNGRADALTMRGLRLNRPLMVLAVIWAAGAVNGFVHAFVLHTGPTSARSVIQQSLPGFYFIATYSIVRRAFREQRDCREVMRTLEVACVAVITEGTILSLLAMSQRFPAMSGIGGLPIVLYDQLSVLFLAVVLVAARLAVGHAGRPVDWLLLPGGVLFHLMSTRRLVLLTLVASLTLTVLLGINRRAALLSMVRVARAALISSAVVFVAATFWLPGFRDALWLTVQSIDVTSDVGSALAGRFRLSQLTNLWLNLQQHAPWSFVFGMGMGTFWYEFESLGLSLTTGSTAYAEGLLDTGSQGWWPGFHLPYISLVFRLGFVGVILVWITVGAWFLGWMRAIRRLHPAERPLPILLMVVCGITLPAIGESLDSSWPALLGLIAGTIEGWVRLARSHVAVGSQVG